MQQAKEDGATLAIYFESRLAKLALKTDELPLIDAEVDELAENEEESQQARLKSRWAALEQVVGAEPGARDRYDIDHPLYRRLAALAALREEHPALADGARRTP